MASLLIIDPGAPHRYFLLGSHRLILVGRDDQCTVQVLDQQVSRRHLQVKLDDADQRHLAIDYESANGVRVNDTRITEPTPLVDGDRIGIGATTIVYLTADHEDAEQAWEAVRKKDEWKRSTVMKR